MDIERINEHTVKFYISYLDVEERGFSRDEIWFNREKSEELFWEMMEEVNDEADIVMEGPLWIQVQALDKGLEVTVSKAQMTKDGQKFDMPDDIEERRKMFGEEDEDAPGFEDFNSVFEDPQVRRLDYMFKLRQVEDLVPLARRLMYVPLETAVYHFENEYYLSVRFDDILHGDEDVKDQLSVIGEYLEKAPMTIHRLEEYGKTIFADNALSNALYYFG